MLALVVFYLVFFQYCAKRLAGKNVCEMTYFIPLRCKTLTHSISQSACYLTDVVKGLVRNWTEPSEPCIQHWCEDGDEKTKDLRQYCSCPPVS